LSGLYLEEKTVPDASGLSVFAVSFFPVAQREADAGGHESEGWDEQYQNRAVEGVLSVFAGGGCRGVAHGAALAEGGQSPEREQDDDD